VLRAPTRALATLVAIALAAVLVPVVGAVAQSAERSQLQEARDRIEQVTRELDAAEAEAESADEELADADERLAEVEAVVNDVAAQLERQRGAVRDAEARLADVEAEAVEIRERLSERAASMFKQGAIRDFDVLLSSEGAEEALARSTYLRALTVGDQVTAESLAAAEIAVDAERERLAEEEERLAGMLAEQEELLAEVEALRERRALAAADARARVEQLESEHDDLTSESARIEDLIRERQEEARQQAAAAASAPAPSSGGGGQATTSAPSSSGYAWPMCAPVTSEYGPRWGRMHQGIDQGASTGTPIGASKAGTVISAGWQNGYGNTVMVDHGDGVVTLYAHMSSIGVSDGASVSQGQTLGQVGSTGNSTGPHLHFETRVNGGAQNPRQYLSGSPC
jgi:murein DD-endopeptidase MepM/ murein hydrolase activator NlpD